MSKFNVSSLYLGKVVQLENDPQEEFRVLITIPALKKTKDGIWAAISSIDAGMNRGVFFRPEIGDDVIIGFVNGDLNSPIILGSLNSKSKPPAIIPSDANNEKGFTSRSKMHIRFNDQKKTITIDTPAGNSILLDESGKQIEIKDQSSNKITMSSSGITLESPLNIAIKAGASLTLTAGNNIAIRGASLSIKADGDVSIKGAISKLSSEGITEITGSLVKIN